jgi:hypothetical protein
VRPRCLLTEAAGFRRRIAFQLSAQLAALGRRQNLVRSVPIGPGSHLVQATDDGGKHVELAIVVHGSAPGEGDFIFTRSRIAFASRDAALLRAVFSEG